MFCHQGPPTGGPPGTPIMPSPQGECERAPALYRATPQGVQQAHGKRLEDNNIGDEDGGGGAVHQEESFFIFTHV